MMSGEQATRTALIGGSILLFFILWGIFNRRRSERQNPWLDIAMLLGSALIVISVLWLASGYIMGQAGSIDTGVYLLKLVGIMVGAILVWLSRKFSR